ncbi:MAG: hypothetical protein J5I41_08905 [Saprospiraceae bacterium]|nr:hypothetical protein [Saprospiraceae bacterium]
MRAVDGLIRLVLVFLTALAPTCVPGQPPSPHFLVPSLLDGGPLRPQRAPAGFPGARRQPAEPFFCRIEKERDARSPIPLRLRLGLAAWQQYPADARMNPVPGTGIPEKPYISHPQVPDKIPPSWKP